MIRKLLALLGLALIVLMVACVCRRYLNLDTLVEHESFLRHRIEEAPLAMAVVGFLIYVAVTLVPGTAGKAVVFGWLFGAVLGTLVVNAALTAAALIMFSISRYCLRDLVRLRFEPQLRRLDEQIAVHGTTSLVVLRLVHTPYTLLNYLLGTTRMPMSSFWWATQLGMLPANAVLAFAGSRLPSLAEVSRHGLSALLTTDLIVALVLLSCVPLVIQHIVTVLWRRRHGDSKILDRSLQRR